MRTPKIIGLGAMLGAASAGLGVGFYTTPTEVREAAYREYSEGVRNRQTISELVTQRRYTYRPNTFSSKTFLISDTKPRREKIRQRMKAEGEKANNKNTPER
uniref:Uncharacterized protein n=1 Tax=Lotharella oceanica TaxID=641309 RepID=A0A7S2TWH3_9EUKA|mmetsp:Transcript_33003/g.61361  ORF Transcript_33003/g.61361 Transcript_33003/m.61361 type:complete len:102 (+) Transcript_33003:220-525(+)